MRMALKEAADAIVFDCDGTLSKLEGIVELAKMNGAEKEVDQLTEEAMSEGIFGEVIYEKRLLLTKPTQKQTEQLGHKYFLHATLDVIDVLKVFKALNKKIFIVTAGVTPAIRIFAEKLEIPEDHIYAVDLLFGDRGEYEDFDRESPLITINGKYHIVEQIKQQHGNVIHIGDGMNDYASFDIVQRFVGFGGNYYRQRMAELCDFYITSESILPLLPLSLTGNEIEKLSEENQALVHQGIALL